MAGYGTGSDDEREPQRFADRGGGDNGARYSDEERRGAPSKSRNSTSRRSPHSASKSRSRSRSRTPRDRKRSKRSRSRSRSRSGSPAEGTRVHIGEIGLKIISFTQNLTVAD